MDRTQDSLSDNLRQMAEGRHDVPEGRAPADPPASPLAPGRRRSGRSTALSTSSRATAASAARAAPSRLRLVAIAALLVVGALLLIPAFWALRLLSGEQVLHYERPSARGMAKVMLVCWPISAALFGGALFYMLQPRGRGR